jgi:hypothetical protein
MHVGDALVETICNKISKNCSQPHPELPVTAVQ